jgi:hypothetical protein
VNADLTPGTARCYLDAIRPFLESRLRDEALDLAGLTAAHVTGFVRPERGTPEPTQRILLEAQERRDRFGAQRPCMPCHFLGRSSPKTHASRSRGSSETPARRSRSAAQERRRATAVEYFTNHILAHHAPPGLPSDLTSSQAVNRTKLLRAHDDARPLQPSPPQDLG